MSGKTERNSSVSSFEAYVNEVTFAFVENSLEEKRKFYGYYIVSLRVSLSAISNENDRV